MSIKLSNAQVEELARPLMKMSQAMAEFFENPVNKSKYREWHLRKYGCEPGEKHG